VVVRINGEERSRDDVGGMRRAWDELVAYAGRNTRLLPGDVIGSGGVDVERDGARLRPGDVVELELAGVGVLRNRVGKRL
jgi:2-keto-4-pentenoate hydratase/2-oxohepta-3-ene-1,7-dioic acid hydratase in catechol pathway